MTLSKHQDDQPGHHRKRFYSSDAHAFVGYTTSYSSPDSFSHTRDTATDDKNNITMVMSPIQNLNSLPPQSSPERMSPPVTKHPHNSHRHHHGNRPRSKSESETSHHRSSYKKKGTNSPGGHYRRVQSPMPVSPSPKYRSLGKMWIRPVPVKNQGDQMFGQQGGAPSSHPTMPFLPGFDQSAPFTGSLRQEDMMMYTSPNSSFDEFQRSSEHSSSKKTAFTFGESGKPITPSLAKRHSPTSVI